MPTNLNPLPSLLATSIVIGLYTYPVELAQFLTVFLPEKTSINLVDGKVVVTLLLHLKLNYSGLGRAGLEPLGTILIILLKKADLKIVEVSQKITKRHEKNPVIFVDVTQELLGIWCPVSAVLIAPLTCSLPLSPRISEFDQLLVSRIAFFGRFNDPASAHRKVELVSGKERISMVSRKTCSPISRVVPSTLDIIGTGTNDPLFFFRFLQTLPVDFRAI